MFKNFLLKKMLRKQGVPEDQIDMFINMIEKDPKLFEEIAKEVKSKIDSGMDQKLAGEEVMKKYESQIKALM